MIHVTIRFYKTMKTLLSNNYSFTSTINFSVYFIVAVIVIQYSQSLFFPEIIITFLIRMLFLRYFLFKSPASYTIYCFEAVILQRCARETFLSRLINNVYTMLGEFSTVCRILRSTLSDGRRVHAAGSLMEDVIGKYLARLRSIRRRVCSRYATNRVIARILLPSAL